MKAKVKRGEDFVETTNIIISIGEYEYRISESKDKRLVLNKISLSGDDDYIRIYPRSGNEIEAN